MSASRHRFLADLHVHTALSPCGGDEMTPPNIIAAALERGLAMIAVCDHNSAGNVTAVCDASLAAGDRLAVLAGMEVTSAEEAHVLGLFPDAAHAEAAGNTVRELLPAADDAYSTYWGEQHLLDAGGAIVGSETKALALATPLNLNAVVALIHEHSGLAVASHADRGAFGVIGQLGVFPSTAGFDAVELSRRVGAGSPRLPEFVALGLPLTAASDAHYLADIGSATTVVTAGEPTFEELRLALLEIDGRSVRLA